MKRRSKKREVLGIKITIQNTLKEVSVWQWSKCFLESSFSLLEQKVREIKDTLQEESRYDWDYINYVGS